MKYLIPHKFILHRILRRQYWWGMFVNDDRTVSNQNIHKKSFKPKRKIWLFAQLSVPLHIKSINDDDKDETMDAYRHPNLRYSTDLMF